jgi:hypothetical protein
MRRKDEKGVVQAEPPERQEDQKLSNNIRTHSQYLGLYLLTSSDTVQSH